MHVNNKVVVMILVGYVLAIARSTGTPITHWQMRESASVGLACISKAE
jgi:hypothetical protein